MIRNLILSGGVAHDYGATSKILVEILEKGEIESEVVEDFSILGTERLQQFHVLTLNCVRWSCRQTPEWSDWAFEIMPEQRTGVLKFLSSGKGLVAIHAASINFDTWPEYGEILGGQWAWGHSGHGPYQLYEINVVDSCHPIMKGVTDFVINDELYHSLTIIGDTHVLTTSIWEKNAQAISWVNIYGSARIYYNALGHSPESFECKQFQHLLRQGTLWASKAI